MTVSTTTRHTAYDGDGATNVFGIPFQFWDDAEIEVKLRVKATGVETVQTQGVDYSITGHTPGANDGSVDFTIGGTPPPATDEVHINRKSLTTQTKDVDPATDPPYAAIEEALDRLALRYQELRADLDQRAVLIPESDLPVSGAAPDMSLPSTVERAVAGAFFGFDPATGDPIVVTGAVPSDVVTTAYGESVVAAADAAAARALIEAVYNRSGVVDSLDAGTRAARPAAVAFGQGVWYSTDTGQVSVNPGGGWVDMVIRHLNNLALNGLTPTVANRLFLDTDNRTLHRDDGAAIVELRAALPRGALGGLKLVRTGGGNDEIQIQPGECRVGTSGSPSLQNAYLTATLTKSLSASGGWVLGDGNAGRPSADALGANKWHHVFLIVQLDGTVDAGFDDQIDASQLLADAGASTWVRYRYIGSVREDGTGTGVIVDFEQEGEWFWWKTIPGLDVSTSAQDYTGADTDVALDWVPPDVRVQADFVARLTSAGSNRFLIANGGVTIGSDPADAASPLAPMSGLDANGQIRQQMRRWTDTSGQVVVRSGGGDTSHDLLIEVHGYRNPRGSHD